MTIIEYRDTNPTINLVDSIRVLSANQAKELEAEVKAAYVKLAPTVVRIWKRDDQGQISNQDSGFSGVIIDRKGLILTCSHHDLAPGTPIIIELADGKQVAGKTLGRFNLEDYKPGYVGPDMGLVTITETNDWPAATIAETTLPIGGQICLVIGYPGTLRPGRPPLLRVGRILPSSPDWLRLESTTTCVVGDSGGPLFDLGGRVLGVLNSTNIVQRYQAITPLKEFRDRLEAGEIVSTPKRAFRALRGHPAQRAAFIPALDLEDRVQQVQHNVIRIMDGPHEIATGLITDPDGWAITKASLVGSRQQWSCRVFYTRDGKMLVNGRVVATSAEHDVALLKLDLKDWFVAPWAAQRPVVGAFVATVLGRTAGPLQFAIVGAEACPELAKSNAIPQIPIYILSNTANSSTEPAVDVNAGRTAEFDSFRALFESGDVITHLNGIATPTRTEFGRVLDRMVYSLKAKGDEVDYNVPLPGTFHGDWVRVGIRRGTVETTVWIPRIHSVTQGGLNWHSHPLSLRRESFPTVFAHDFSLRPEQCGGPVVDLAGNVVGLNIARVDETRTLAIPADVLQTIIKDLRKQAENAVE